VPTLSWLCTLADYQKACRLVLWVNLLLSSDDDDDDDDELDEVSPLFCLFFETAIALLTAHEMVPALDDEASELSYLNAHSTSVHEIANANFVVTPSLAMKYDTHLHHSLEEDQSRCVGHSVHVLALYHLPSHTECFH